MTESDAARRQKKNRLRIPNLRLKTAGRIEIFIVQPSLQQFWVTPMFQGEMPRRLPLRVRMGSWRKIAGKFSQVTSGIQDRPAVIQRDSAVPWQVASL